MTDRYLTLTVVLDKDTRDDDAQGLVDAISLMKGVMSVEGNVADVQDYMARATAIDLWREKLIDVLWPPTERPPGLKLKP